MKAKKRRRDSPVEPRENVKVRTTVGGQEKLQRTLTIFFIIKYSM